MFHVFHTRPLAVFQGRHLRSNSLTSKFPSATWSAIFSCHWIIDQSVGRPWETGSLHSEDMQKTQKHRNVGVRRYSSQIRPRESDSNWCQVALKKRPPWDNVLTFHGLGKYHRRRQESQALWNCPCPNLYLLISLLHLYYCMLLIYKWHPFKQNHPPFQTQCHRSQRSRGRSSSAMPFSGCPNLEKSTPRPSIESCFNWKAEFFEFFDFEFQTDPSMELRDLHDLACARESKTCRECFCSLLAWEIEKANHKDLEDASLWPHLWFSHHQPCTMHWQFVQKSRIISDINLCILFLHSFAGKQLWTPILSMQLGIHTSDLKKWNELDWCFACFACFVAFFFRCLHRNCGSGIGDRFRLGDPIADSSHYTTNALYLEEEEDMSPINVFVMPRLLIRMFLASLR